MSLKPKKAMSTKEYLLQVRAAATKAGLALMTSGTFKNALVGKKKHYRLFKKKGSNRPVFTGGFSTF